MKKIKELEEVLYEKGELPFSSLNVNEDGYYELSNTDLAHLLALKNTLAYKPILHEYKMFAEEGVYDNVPKIGYELINLDIDRVDEELIKIDFIIMNSLVGGKKVDLIAFYNAIEKQDISTDDISVVHSVSAWLTSLENKIVQDEAVASIYSDYRAKCNTFFSNVIKNNCAVERLKK